MPSSDEPGSCPTATGALPVQPTYRIAKQYFWPWVLCLLGLDYFSTLAYQPSITFEVAGRLGPLATIGVVVLTLAGALPVYCYLAGRSPAGSGSLGMVEQVVRGWRGKTLVLVLLGFAATDFIMLKTISLADAAVHVLSNDAAGWRQGIGQLTQWLRVQSAHNIGDEADQFFNEQIVATLLLGVLGFGFWFLLRKGFNRNVIVLAVPLVILFLACNALILGAGLKTLLEDPDRWQRWLDQVQGGDWLIEPPAWSGFGWGSVALLSLLFLPHLALGLSGFEMSMILMPQVKGDATDTPRAPRGRIHNTRKVLIVAALIMSLYLLASSFVTGLLIPPQELAPGGKAVNRAMAYLAHGGPLSDGDARLAPWCGAFFGSLFDVTTVLVLVLAGTSVMTALAVLLPQFLLRFGMELKWAQRWGLLLILFGLINLTVTLYFQAQVDSQRRAYTTAVLVLMACGSLVAAGDWRKKKSGTTWGRLGAAFFGVTAGVFVVVAVAVAWRSFNGLAIAGLFIVAILAMSVISRALRADELRTVGFEMKDDTSRFFWDSLRLADFPVLVPHRPGRHERELKEEQIRSDHQLAPEADIVFLEVEVDDPSNFYQNLLIEVVREDHRIVIKVTRCVSVAHAIAAIALEMSRWSKPPGLHFGWSELDLLSASWSYFAFGEGNIPWKVRELIEHAEPDPAKRPRVIVG